MNAKKTWQDKPREQGKRAYQEGIPLSENPNHDHGRRLEWTEGWCYQRKNYPHPKDAREALQDMDCLSPWAGDESGYGGYF